jgi:lipopolysaccharide heptosyltransferase I
VSEAGPRQILIVRPSALGDVCRTVPAIRTLRRAFPDAAIDILLQETSAEVFRHDPDIREVLCFPRHRIRGAAGLARLPGIFRALGRELRRRRYDLAIDLQGLARSGLMTWLSRAPARVGFANAREFGWLGYNRRHHVDASLHHVERLLELLGREGLEPVGEADLHTGAADAQWLDDYLGAHGGAGMRYACLAPTSRWLCKAWPLERYGEIGRRLLAGHVDALAIVCGPGERSYAEPLARALGDAGRVMMPETTVGQLLALVSRARLVVGNDSAPLHAAVGLRRPLVAVFGPTDPALVGPYRREDCVVRPPGAAGRGSIGFYRTQKDDQTLISQVPVDAVWQVAAAQLAGEQGARAAASD